MYNYPPALSTPPAINSYGGEVKSIEEVRTARVDPCGSLTFFLSPTEHKIYVKYIDLSGLPVIEVYDKAKGQEESLNELRISFRDSAQLLFRRLSFQHLQVQLPLLLNNRLVVS